MATWSDFHSDPRKSYYLFLRQGYGCPAHAAHARVKRLDRMVLDLQDESHNAAATSWLASFTRLLGLVSASWISLKRLWESVPLRHAPAPARAESRVASRFSQTI